MRIRLPKAIAVMVALATPAAISAAATAVSTAALAAWLPDPNSGDAAWRNAQTAVTNQYDYFVCGGVQTASEGKQSFYYAGSGCPLMKKGTTFTYAPSGKGTVLYDRVHGIVLYDKGCCAERGFALTANMGPPPKSVANADLTGVRTRRGVSLNMTQAQVLRIYGSTRSYDVKGRPGVTTLSYTTMKTKPNEPGGACAQFQSFSFRRDRLTSVELLFAC